MIGVELIMQYVCHIFILLVFILLISFFIILSIYYIKKTILLQKTPPLIPPDETQAMFPFGHETVSIWKLSVLTGSQFGSFVKTANLSRGY